MNRNNDRCSLGSFLAGTLAGALIGAGLALLYAPKTGEETRKDIKDKVKKLKEEAELAKEKTLDKLAEVKKSAVTRAEDIKARAKKAASEFKKEEKNR